MSDLSTTNDISQALSSNPMVFSSHRNASQILHCYLDTQDDDDDDQGGGLMSPVFQGT